MGGEDLRIQERSVKALKRMLVEKFDVYHSCGEGALKYHLRNRMGKDIPIVGTISVLDSSSYEYFVCIHRASI